MPSVIAPYGCYLVALGDNVEAGEVVDVDDATYASLVEQGWESASEAKPEKASPSRARSKPAGMVEED